MHAMMPGYLVTSGTDSTGPSIAEPSACSLQGAQMQGHNNFMLPAQPIQDEIIYREAQ